MHVQIWNTPTGRPNCVDSVLPDISCTSLFLPFPDFFFLLLSGAKRAAPFRPTRVICRKSVRFKKIKMWWTVPPKSGVVFVADSWLIRELSKTTSFDECRIALVEVSYLLYASVGGSILQLSCMRASGCCRNSRFLLLESVVPSNVAAWHSNNFYLNPWEKAW